MTKMVNMAATPILALDAPSGVDTGTDLIHSPAIRASATMTPALLKLGLNVGPIFAMSDVVRLR